MAARDPSKRVSTSHKHRSQGILFILSSQFPALLPSLSQKVLNVFQSCVSIADARWRRSERQASRQDNDFDFFLYDKNLDLLTPTTVN